MIIRAFSCPKRCEQAEDNQDCYKVAEDSRALALSDGMSQSLFPREWAELLVKRFCEDDTWSLEEKDLVEERAQWLHEAERRQRSAEPRVARRIGNALQQGQGAGATLVGLRFTGGDAWEAYALGDSSLVRVGSRYKLLELWNSQGGRFDNTPDYFDALSASGAGSPSQCRGTLAEGEYLLLVSDPIGALLDRLEEDKHPEVLRRLCTLEDENTFRDYVERLRTEYEMTDDDTTLLIVTLGESAVSPVEEPTFHLASRRNERETKMFVQLFLAVFLLLVVLRIFSAFSTRLDGGESKR